MFLYYYLVILMFVHISEQCPDAIKFLTSNRFLYLFGNLIPCSCAYFQMLRRMPQTNIYADCLLYNNADKNIQHWLERILIFGYATLQRLFQKKFPSFCSFNATGSNFTCVFIQDDTSREKSGWSQNMLVEKYCNSSVMNGVLGIETFIAMGGWCTWY